MVFALRTFTVVKSNGNFLVGNDKKISLLSPAVLLAYVKNSINTLVVEDRYGDMATIQVSEDVTAMAYLKPVHVALENSAGKIGSGIAGTISYINPDAVLTVVNHTNKNDLTIQGLIVLKGPNKATYELQTTETGTATLAAIA